MSLYDYTVKDRKGNEVSLEQYRDKVVLVVNTATGCGFTPQYKELEEMYEKYHEKGLEILDIPCNQFAGQTPGSTPGSSPRRASRASARAPWPWP